MAWQGFADIADRHANVGGTGAVDADTDLRFAFNEVIADLG